ncbi:hypothetical protein [uncultured Campylobacter sp.]|nr:hypothetical protein [uncultured Campylobacter sp.]
MELRIAKFRERNSKVKFYAKPIRAEFCSREGFAKYGMEYLSKISRIWGV